jgi:5-methylcytosine-specific restriction protein A
MARDAGRCRRCGAIGHQIHHRRPRGMGGTSDPLINNPSNLVLLCQPCHAEVESAREQAYDSGWLLRHASLELPSEVPLVDLQGRTFFLTEEGTVVGVGHIRGDPPSAGGEVALSSGMHTVPAPPPAQDGSHR